MTIKQWLFSFEGRIGRQRFWMWNLFYYAVILGLGVFLSQSGLGNSANYILLIITAGLLIPDLAVTAKRWHDRNKSNGWLLMHIPLIAGRLYAPEAAMAEPTTMQIAVSLIALACGIWMLIECGFMKGTSGHNQYGSEPQ
ncbi:DUF805 domain-containing protein [Vibrio rumoiensis]|uniref:DUF805 domain-containing protein n=1 Tax=Vibrio rumoiensis 1S-45 TaxID=1188252 RepID=A0A1E5E6B1_9VIBR|nr:DUF805 domain-containing protein [Vibrio rumoiensis]OEF30036.1 hypothetical protein A1QC_03335 [Vibrio rumoiensis 1S-45]